MSKFAVAWIKFRTRTKAKNEFDENNITNETKSKLLDKIKTAIASRKEFSYSAWGYSLFAGEKGFPIAEYLRFGIPFLTHDGSLSRLRGREREKRERRHVTILI